MPFGELEELKLVGALLGLGCDLLCPCNESDFAGQVWDLGGGELYGQGLKVKIEVMDG
jgi:hypothetical protein